MKKRKTWSNEEVEYLKENYGKIPTKELAEQFGVSKQAIIDKYNCNVYSFKIKSNETLKIYHWMYENSTTHLDRKYNKYIEYKNNLKSINSVPS